MSPFLMKSQRCGVKMTRGKKEGVEYRVKETETWVDVCRVEREKRETQKWVKSEAREMEEENGRLP